MTYVATSIPLYPFLGGVDKFEGGDVDLAAYTVVVKDSFKLQCTVGDHFWHLQHLSDYRMVVATFSKRQYFGIARTQTPHC